MTNVPITFAGVFVAALGGAIAIGILAIKSRGRCPPRILVQWLRSRAARSDAS